MSLPLQARLLLLDLLVDFLSDFSFSLLLFLRVLMFPCFLVYSQRKKLLLPCLGLPAEGTAGSCSSLEDATESHQSLQSCLQWEITILAATFIFSHGYKMLGLVLAADGEGPTLMYMSPMLTQTRSQYFCCKAVEV